MNSIDWGRVGKITAVVAVVILAILGTFAAIKYSIDHYVAAGPVVARQFTPAHEETYMSYEYAYNQCNYNPSTKSTDCEAVYHFVPRVRWVSDEWSVLVQGHCKEDGTGCDTTWHDVSQQEYDALPIGQWYGPTPVPTYGWQ